MLNMDEKMVLFTEYINRKTQQKLSDIDNDFSRFLQDENQRIEQMVATKSRKMIERETKALSSALNSKVSKEMHGFRKNLLELRRESTETLFQEAAAQLQEYSKTPEYKSYLADKIASIKPIMKPGGCRIQVKKDDLEDVEKIVRREFPELQCTVEQSEKIILGGFVFENYTDGLRYNHSMDEMLENRKDWFYMNSGLQID